MIHVNGEEFVLNWRGDAWRDKAGHVWNLSDNGTLSSNKHGTFSLHSYKVVPMEQEEENENT